MKKVSLLTLLLLSITLFSCSSDDDGGNSVDPIVGWWKLESVKNNGTTIQVNRCRAKNTIHFMENATFISLFYVSNAVEDCIPIGAINGAWNSSGNTYQITPDRQTIYSDVIFSDNNKRLSITEDNSVGKAKSITITTYVHQ